ncbi:hypothetical protein TeGR_g3440, partial [Tetraparma gracilis]
MVESGSLLGQFLLEVPSLASEVLFQALLRSFLNPLPSLLLLLSLLFLRHSLALNLAAGEGVLRWLGGLFLLPPLLLLLALAARRDPGGAGAPRRGRFGGRGTAVGLLLCGAGFAAGELGRGGTPGAGARELAVLQAEKSEAPKLARQMKAVADPQNCVQILVEGCAGTYWGAEINGKYDLYEGDCGSSPPAFFAFHNPVGNMYNYFDPEWGDWNIGLNCGVSPVVA